ncbi:ABC transporter substrate-binding protein [Sphingobium sp. H33]|uniref:ABC transporter substrate-binding protein n=2 Tax=Sphingobium nicotianae TaxID=2782607 RepID=A0A9X1IRB1_9SPHN|nr:ABC transporter substrate-binding protein [Sphingobium nicotianae]MBT2187291.1 ABC transporter substrate-binding protein [Sphingobium nicotianae]
MATAGCASRAVQPRATPGDLRFSAHAVIEAAPVHYAIRHLAAARPEIPNGAIPSLYQVPESAAADLAGHADTQALRHSLTHPDLRIILTITEGQYRIVGKRSARIRSVADLRGRKIATVRDSSAAFYLHTALATAGMTDADVEIVPLPLPPKDSARLLLDGGADALVLWDPEPESAIEQLGGDAVILQPDTRYRELYNLHATAAKLADPASRAKIVRFVARLVEASEHMRRDPADAIILAAQATGYPEKLVRAAWPHQSFPATLSADLLDTLVSEEAWLAARDGRTPRTRENLARLIDPSIEAEARALSRRKE